MHSSPQLASSLKVKRSEKLRHVSPTGHNVFHHHASFLKRHRTSLHILALSLFTFILYQGAINNDYAYDDPIMSYSNRFVQQGMQGIPAIFSNAYLRGFNNAQSDMTSYRPLPLAATAVEKQLFGNNPKIHHAANILYYLVAVLLLYGFLRMLFRDAGATMPFVVSLLFAAHPLHTEAVANIKNREELLCFLFMMAALVFTLRHVYTLKIIHLALGLAAFLLCALSKDNGISFVLLVPLTLHFVGKVSLKRNAMITASFFAVAVVYLAIRAHVLGGLAVNANESVSMDNNALMTAATGIDRLATAVAYLGKYAFMLLWPHPLSCDYSYNQLPLVRWTDPRALLSLAFFAGLLVLAIIRFKSRSIFSYGLFFSFISFSMVSNLFVTLGATFAERFTFMASVGFCLAAGALLTGIRRFSGGRSARLGWRALAILIAMLALYGIGVLSRVPDWKDSLTLFSTDVKNCPNSFRLQKNLGEVLMAKAKASSSAEAQLNLFADARTHLRRSLEIYPNQPPEWYSFGVCSFKLNDVPQAMEGFGKALSMTPDLKGALNGMGYCYFVEHQPDSTLLYCGKALALDSNYALASANSGLAYQLKGQYLKAMQCYEKAARLDPGLDSSYLSNLDGIRRFLRNAGNAKGHSHLIRSSSNHH